MLWDASEKGVSVGVVLGFAEACRCLHPLSSALPIQEPLSTNKEIGGRKAPSSLCTARCLLRSFPHLPESLESQEVGHRTQGAPSHFSILCNLRPKNLQPQIQEAASGKEAGV